jgi:hypothetical protein
MTYSVKDPSVLLASILGIPAAILNKLVSYVKRFARRARGTQYNESIVWSLLRSLLVPALCETAQSEGNECSGDLVSVIIALLLNSTMI